MSRRMNPRYSVDTGSKSRCQLRRDPDVAAELVTVTRWRHLVWTHCAPAASAGAKEPPAVVVFTDGLDKPAVDVCAGVAIDSSIDVPVKSSPSWNRFDIDSTSGRRAKSPAVGRARDLAWTGDTCSLPHPGRAQSRGAQMGRTAAQYLIASSREAIPVDGSLSDAKQEMIVAPEWLHRGRLPEFV